MMLVKFSPKSMASNGQPMTKMWPGIIGLSYESTGGVLSSYTSWLIKDFLQTHWLNALPEHWVNGFAKNPYCLWSCCFYLRCAGCFFLLYTSRLIMRYHADFTRTVFSLHITRRLFRHIFPDRILFPEHFPELPPVIHILSRVHKGITNHITDHQKYWEVKERGVKLQLHSNINEEKIDLIWAEAYNEADANNG